jgi:hypothetical protein
MSNERRETEWYSIDTERAETISIAKARNSTDDYVFSFRTRDNREYESVKIELTPTAMDGLCDQLSNRLDHSGYPTSSSLKQYSLAPQNADAVQISPILQSAARRLSFNTTHSESQPDQVDIILPPTALVQLYEQLRGIVAEDIDTHLTQLFGTKTRREIIKFVLKNIDQEGFSMKDITNSVDTSREAARQELYEEPPWMREYGIVEVPNPDANIPRIDPSENKITKILQSWEGYPLDELLKTRGKQRLAEFLLFDIDVDRWYLQSEIIDESDAGYKAVANNLPEFVDAGVVERRSGSRGQEYRVDLNAPIRSVLLEIETTARRKYKE